MNGNVRCVVGRASDWVAHTIDACCGEAGQTLHVAEVVVEVVGGEEAVDGGYGGVEGG